MSKQPAIVPEFEVSDLDVTKDVYINIFGFQVDYERPEDHFAYMVKGDAHLCSKS